MQNEIKSNSVVFAGPFMGEFGWELSHWVPHLRWLRDQYRGKRLIASSYKGLEPLYFGIADEFWPLPDWFVDKKYDRDCFESLSDDNHYEELILHFKNELTRKFPPENIQWTKPPRGYNHILRDMNQVVFQKFEASPEANKIADDLIFNHGNKPVIVLFARNVNREMFLDIVNNKPRYVEDCYPEGLPTRNWPRSHWNDLFKMLYSRFGKQFTFAIGGTKGGNCLLEAAQSNNDVIDLTEFDIDQSLDITIAMLNRAFLSISSQSGPTHLSVQCGCPSFVYGHEQERHTQTDNPLRTDIVFFETQLGLYNDPPESLFKEISVYLELLISEQGVILSGQQSGQNSPKSYTNAKGGTVNYSPEYYEEKSEDWIKNITSEQILLDKWDDDWHQSYVYRWNKWFKDIEISGRVLDVGFQNGKTLYALSQKYPDAKIDALDFNPALSKAIPFYKKLMPNLDDIWIGDCQYVNKPDGHYDYIHCIDFFEHLPHDVYEKTIIEIHRLLRNLGQVFVYVGKTDAHAHINLISNEAIVRDMESCGFRFVSDVSDMLVFEKIPMIYATEIDTYSVKESRFPSPTKARIKKIGFVGVFDNPDSTNIPFAKAFQKAGYHVEVFNYRTVSNEIGYGAMNAELVKFADTFDLMIICKGNGITPETIKTCSLKTKVCFYMMDALLHLENDNTYYSMAHASGLSVVVAREVANALIGDGVQSVHHVLQGVDPLQFRPVSNKKDCNIVFIGQCTEKRKKILDDMVASLSNTKGFSIRAYGKGFNKEVYGDEFNKACSEGDILLAINNTDSDQDSFSDRILRYMATGGCVVTEYSKGLEKYFVNGKHLAWPVGDETLTTVIQRLLKHPKMMEQMARNGYKYVLENHTWDKVVEQILVIVETQ